MGPVASSILGVDKGNWWGFKWGKKRCSTMESAARGALCLKVHDYVVNKLHTILVQYV